MQGWSSHTEKKCKPSEDHWISRVSIPFCYFQQVPSPANWSSFFPNNPGSVLPRKMVVYGYHQSNLSSTGPWSRTKPCLMKRYQKWRIQQTESKTFTSFASTRSKILCFWMPESEHVIHHLNLSGGAWPKIHLGLVSFLLVEESLFQKLFEKKEKKKRKKTAVPSYLVQVKEQFCLRPPLQALDQGWVLLQTNRRSQLKHPASGWLK